MIDRRSFCRKRVEVLREILPNVRRIGLLGDSDRTGDDPAACGQGHRMNRRRLLVFALGASISGHTALSQAQTSSGSIRRVGVLAPSTQAKEEIILKPFFDQMRQLGWVEGQNIAYDRVYADDQQQMLPRLAAELVARKPEVIYAPPTPAAVAAKQATQTIPIVFGVVFDPVGIGLVTSLARPGGNVTGIGFSESLAPKRIELLREFLPGVKRLGLLGDSTDPTTRRDQRALAPLAASLGLTLVFTEAANPAEFEAAVAGLIAERVDAILVAGVSPLVGNLGARLIELANQQRIPVVAGGSFADAGALFSYSGSFVDRSRRSAMMVDKILKGAKPADLPVEQPTSFDLVVNLKAAKALGITSPAVHPAACGQGDRMTPLRSSLRHVRGSQGHRVADCAHVPRVGLRPPLLLYFAPSATRRPWPDTAVAPHRRIPQRFRSWPVGRSAQRSKGGGAAEGRRRGSAPGHKQSCGLFVPGARLGLRPQA